MLDFQAAPGGGSPDPLGIDARIRAFAEDVGPASVAFVQRANVLDSIRQRVTAGVDVEDAVLTEIHSVMSRSRRLTDEFVLFFIYDLMCMGKHSMPSNSSLRRFLDTGDLVLSVFGDLGGDLSKLAFSTRDQFKRFFATRIDWKAIDKARGLQTKGRQEGKRVPQQPEELELSHDDPERAPLAQMIRGEQKEQLIMILLQLAPRDRQLLTLHLKGRSLDQMAEDLELSYDAARKALKRAIQRARQLAQPELATPPSF